MAFRDHMDEVLRMVRLRISFVRTEVGTVLEARLGDHTATRQVLVCAKAEVEVRLDRLRFLRETCEPDGPVRVRIADLRESSLQEVCGLQEAELQPTSDHLAEKPGLMEGTSLRLVDHDGAVSEEVHNDPFLRRAHRPMAAGVRLPDAIIGEVALLVDEAQQQGLADRGRFFGTRQELRQVEHGPLAQARTQYLLGVFFGAPPRGYTWKSTEPSRDSTMYPRCRRSR